MKISYIPTHIVTRNYNDIDVVYNLSRKNIITLSNVASDIWNYIYASKPYTSFESVLHHISQLYDVPSEEIKSDVSDFINELFKDYFIEIDDNSYKYENKDIHLEVNSFDIEGEIIRLMQERNQIYSTTFELTYSCNEKCVHCYASYPEENVSHNVLELDKCKKIIDELYEMKCLHIIFTGGDPFMFKGFIELFKYARNKNFVCDIYTNGQAIANNSKILDEIVPLFPRAFYISLYGSTSEVHDGITCVAGSFEKTLKTIKLLHKDNISVVLNVMIMKNNYHQIKEIIGLAKKLGVEYRVGLSIINKNNGDTTPMNYFIDDKNIIKQIIDIVDSNIYSMDISTDSKRDSQFICGAGTTALCVSPDGEVYPCVSLKTSLGSVFDSSIKEIWEGKKRKDLVSALIWSNTKKCNNCNLLSECPHCVGISKAESGDALACNSCDKLIAECSYELKNKCKRVDI